MIEPEQLFALANRLEPLKYFPRSPEGVAEVAILIGELCDSPTTAETIIRAVLRSDLDEWPGMATFRRMVSRQVAELRAPSPDTAPATANDRPPLDPELARFQRKLERAERIWAEMDRPEKVEKFLHAQRELLANPDWKRTHSVQETQAQAQQNCIMAILYDLPEILEESPAPPIPAAREIAPPPATRPADARPHSHRPDRQRAKKHRYG